MQPLSSKSPFMLSVDDNNIVECAINLLVNEVMEVKFKWNPKAPGNVRDKVYKCTY